MKTIKYDNDESYVDDIKEIVKDFDSYQFISDKIDIIIKSIDSNIKSIIYDDTDEIYHKLHIDLYDDKCYAINYDGKNYPLISFYANRITIDSMDTIIRINNDDLIIDLYYIDLKDFQIIEQVLSMDYDKILEINSRLNENTDKFIESINELIKGVENEF